MRIDLHVHSRHSDDGVASVAAILRRARRKGLDGIAIADHNTSAGTREALALAAPDMLVIPAIECATELGHILVYGLAEGIDDNPGLRRPDGNFDAAALSSFARARGGVVYAAHPYRHRDTLPDGLLALVDGFEIFNARENARRPKTGELAERLFEDTNKPVTAGSDAHLLPEIGGGWVEIGTTDMNGVLIALRTGGLCCGGRPAARTWEAVSRLRSRTGSVAQLVRNLLRVGWFLCKDIGSLFTRSRKERHF